MTEKNKKIIRINPSSLNTTTLPLAIPVPAPRVNPNPITLDEINEIFPGYSTPRRGGKKNTKKNKITKKRKSNKNSSQK